MRSDWFGAKGRPLIGVDVSASAVKMLELSGGVKAGYRIERYAIVPLPKDAVADGHIAKPEAVESAMAEAWQLLGTRTRAIAMALPSSVVISKKVLVPTKASEAEIEAQITAEANQMVSFPIDEIHLDYQVLGPSSNSPGDDEALIVLSRRDRIEERVAIAEAVGLKTVIMDVDNLAALTAYEQIAPELPHGGKRQTVAIIDIGANFIHIDILHDNEPVFHRTHAFGGSILTKEVARLYGLSLEEAEVAKRQGTLPESYATEVLPAFLNSAAHGIQRSLQLFYSSSSYPSVDHILLTGGCARLPGLTEAVRDKSQTDVRVANPFARMSVAPHIGRPRLEEDASMLFVACGLALRRFDRK